MAVYGYLRVSTLTQAKEGESLEAQRLQGLGAKKRCVENYLHGKQSKITPLRWNDF